MYRVYLKCFDKLLQRWVINLKTKKKVYMNMCPETSAFIVDFRAVESVHKSSDSDSSIFKTSDSDSSIFKTPTPIPS
jgi:hypothetical protein